MSELPLKKEQDGRLQIMEWPAQSPDLNSIELVWDELDRRVKAKQPTSATLCGNFCNSGGKNFPINI